MERFGLRLENSGRADGFFESRIAQSVTFSRLVFKSCSCRYGYVSLIAAAAASDAGAGAPKH